MCNVRPVCNQVALKLQAIMCSHRKDDASTTEMVIYVYIDDCKTKQQGFETLNAYGVGYVLDQD